MIRRVIRPVSNSNREIGTLSSTERSLDKGSRASLRRDACLNFRTLFSLYH